MTERLIDSHLTGVEVRRSVHNRRESIRVIVDGYLIYTITSPAIQNDAIQNG